ncbi:hypothetical protein BBJ29_003921 [Phytophthora kernoviae]|uniref:Mitochondrial splicing suppressor 51-like C-terminal domain-containing protein n=1 Tax=Phytophthora kernoviae TaxID=325452 RepID=A0A3F2S2D1_9STRA|nr:hypothetical protein BBJ29_003921 [Phytophthora kernoviae]RLN68915.1 hypothetical protein BBP00_00000733 [Phytophthora kernoviae]
MTFLKIPMFKQLVRHRQLLAQGSLGAVRSISAQQLRVPGAQTLVRTVARAPCLQCGHSCNLPHSADISQVLETRMDCGSAQLPLACSKECAEKLEKNEQQLMDEYGSMLEDLEFAATPEASQLFAEVLQPSRRDSSNWKSDRHMTSWMEYLQLYKPEDRWVEDVRALRLLSSAYSYVLTLSRFLPELLATDNKQKLELHVIGARAEAMMPRYLWDELSFFHPDHQFAIKLIGDHVPVMPKRMQASGNSDAQSAIQLETINGLYHELKPGKVGTPDAFVMYNPGPLAYSFSRRRICCPRTAFGLNVRDGDCRQTLGLLSYSLV